MSRTTKTKQKAKERARAKAKTNLGGLGIGIPDGVAIGSHGSAMMKTPEIEAGGQAVGASIETSARTEMIARAPPAPPQCHLAAIRAS